MTSKYNVFKTLAAIAAILLAVAATLWFAVNAQFAIEDGGANNVLAAVLTFCGSAGAWSSALSVIKGVRRLYAVAHCIVWLIWSAVAEANYLGLNLGPLYNQLALSQPFIHFFWVTFASAAVALAYLLSEHAAADDFPSVATALHRGALTNDNWHDWLLASLADTGVRKPPVDRYRFILAPVLMSVVLITLYALINLAIVYTVRNAAVPINPQSVSPLFYIGLAAIGVGVAFVQRQVHVSIAKARALSAYDEIKRDGSRRPVLYLRSFAYDRQLRRTSWFAKLIYYAWARTAEQHVTRALSSIGPVIAIGKPGERLPELGAARFYCATDLWRDKVADVAAVARKVVWTTGQGDGLAWELGHLVEHVAPERLLIWCHPHLLRLGEREREIAWLKFTQTLGRKFPEPLPVPLENTRFIGFDKSWHPIRYTGESDQRALAEAIY